MDGNINQNNRLKLKKTTLNCIQIILLVFKMNTGKLKYRIYSSEHPGCSFNFEFSNGGTYSREVLFRGRCSLNISKRHQNTFNLSFKSNNKNSNNNKKTEYLIFKIVCKTPLFNKEK